MTKCPHCNKHAYPVKNDDGSINWKNVWRIDWINLVMVIGILLMLFGFYQINQQCFQVLEEPCKFIDQYDCNGQYYKPLYGDEAKNGAIEQYWYGVDNEDTLPESGE